MDEHERCVLTAESGRVCVDWGIFHKFAEKIMGHPIWTHEFAMPETTLELKIRILTGHKTERIVSPIVTLEQLVPKEKILVAVVDTPSDQQERS